MRICLYCDEELPDGYPSVGWTGMHKECVQRQVSGSLDCITRGPHAVGTCDGDPPGVSKRDAARAVVDQVRRVMGMAPLDWSRLDPWAP